MKPLSQIALLLSLLGGAFDFASASLIIQSNPGLTPWAVGLYVFGVVIIVTGILNVTSFAMARMNLLGGLMLAYGVAMLVIGWIMYSVPIMIAESGVDSGIGMFLTGISMIASGSIMSARARKVGTMEMKPQGLFGRDIIVLSLVLAVLFGFGLGFIFNQAAGPHVLTGMMTNQQQNASSMGEQLSLTRFDFTNLTTVKMVLTNTGNSSVTISRVLFNGTDVTPATYLNCITNYVSSNNVSLTMPIDSQAECKLSLPVSGVNAGTIYPIRIITASGVQFVFDLTAGATNITM